MGQYDEIHEVVTAPRSPWWNAYVERLIGSIRRECLDHVIVLSVAGLQRVLAHYVAYYMNTRTHLSLVKDAPVSRPVTPLSTGRIVEIPQGTGCITATSARRHSEGSKKAASFLYCLRADGLPLVFRQVGAELQEPALE